ncbi:MAG: hypothetical protein KDB03_03330 [Planctomycetales bacterium]|nr:hypothetical protein [Planctomycetales bacterium]
MTKPQLTGFQQDGVATYQQKDKLETYPTATNADSFAPPKDATNNMSPTLEWHTSTT